MTAPAPPRPMRDADDADELVAFDLRDLASTAQERDTWRAGRTDDDPFGMLGIEGVAVVPATDPLAELLGADPAQRRGPSQRPPPGREDDAPVGSPTEPPGRSPAAAREDALFAELHEAFVRTVRDPTRPSDAADRDGASAPGGATAPSFDELVRQAEPFRTVRAILEPREPIDRVLDSFDTWGRPTLLDFRDDEDILRLFAPETARQAVAAMPTLTRQEHHHLSPDSAVRLGAAPSGEDGNAA